MFPMTLVEVARYLDLNKHTVVRFARECGLKARRMPPKGYGFPCDWEFDRDDVDDFIDSCRIEPGTLTSGRPWLRGVRL